MKKKNFLSIQKQLAMLNTNSHLDGENYGELQIVQIMIYLVIWNILKNP